MTLLLFSCFLPRVGAERADGERGDEVRMIHDTGRLAQVPKSLGHRETTVKDVEMICGRR